MQEIYENVVSISARLVMNNQEKNGIFFSALQVYLFSVY